LNELHKPVLLKECIDGLNIKQDGIYLDGTLGRAGHSLEIVKRLESGRLIAIDRDETAIRESSERVGKYADKITFFHGNFKNVKQILSGLGIDKVDGMLFDLGVSSPQLDDAKRGFSYMADAPLDMRMDETSSFSAFDVVNGWDEQKLKKILYEYGEERYAPRIAYNIIKRRAIRPIKTTFELVDIIRGSMPPTALREKQHPAKRSFQAIRIAVNDELGSISGMLSDATDMLAKGGRLAVISFHSLEDRLVKNAMQSGDKGCTCPKDLPMCVCGFVPRLKILTKKPVTASEEELKENPRARSAKLRIAERL
jgi:16S rRNA (cytosine1402-N4)-methyltransferase